MNELSKNYIAYVCSYFHLGRKIKVRKELTEQIKEHEHDYYSLTDELVSFGHPKSMAYTMGYRPFLTHQFHRDLLGKFTYIVLVFFDLLLLIASFFYLASFGYIYAPKFVADVMAHKYVSLFFIHPFLCICIAFALFLMVFVIADCTRKDKVEEDLSWNEERLKSIPSYRAYSHHLYESIIMIAITIYFIVFTVVFTLNIVDYNKSTNALIRTIFYFLQPYLATIYLSYFLDLTKRTYNKAYLIMSLITNLLILIPVNIAVIRSQFLTDFMLPVATRSANGLINVFVVTSVMAIEGMVIFKIFKNTINLWRLHLSNSPQRQDDKD